MTTEARHAGARACGPVLGALIAALAVLGSAPAPRAQSPRSTSHPMNVLFITVDDLRPMGATFDVPQVQTLHMDRLARRGMVFTRAYVQQAVCSPSRTSLFTGRRPDTTGIRDLNTHFRVNLPDVVTLPQHFRQHGYVSVGIGKNYHNQLDDPRSWSVPAWFPVGDAGVVGEEYAWGDPALIARLQAARDDLIAEGHQVGLYPVEIDPETGTHLRITSGERVKGPSWEAADVDDDALPDGKSAAKAVEMLRLLQDQPFFLAVGFIRPHLPFVAPTRDFEPYPLARIQLPDDHPPEDVPEVALHNWGELRTYEEIPGSGPLDDRQARELIRAYYAATTYVDRQVGRVLDELERLGLADETIVVLWGDHGYHLGEHGLWNKHTNFETSTRAPLIISVPGKDAGQTHALVELVDVFPTLTELAGLPDSDGMEGLSVVPLLEDPTRPWKPAAFSEYPRRDLLGRSIRTDRYRYTEWATPGEAPAAQELYDHDTDPGETVNLAGQPDARDLVTELARQLHAGWRAALP